MKIFIVVFTRHSTGKIWSPISVQDNAWPVLHYQICLTDCNLLRYLINLMKTIT